MPRHLVLPLALALAAGVARAEEKVRFERLRVWTFHSLGWVVIDGRGQLETEIPHRKSAVSPYLLGRIAAEVGHVYKQARGSAPPRERITVRLPDGTPKPTSCECEVPFLQLNQDELATRVPGKVAVIVGGKSLLVDRAECEPLFALVDLVVSDHLHEKSTQLISGKVELGPSGQVLLNDGKRRIRVGLDPENALRDALGALAGKTVDLVLGTEYVVQGKESEGGAKTEYVPVRSFVELVRARDQGSPLLVRGVEKSADGRPVYKAYDTATHRMVTLNGPEVGLPELAIVSEPPVPAPCDGLIDAIGGKKRP